jgi:hypothetical protein
VSLSPDRPVCTCSATVAQLPLLVCAVVDVFVAVAVVVVEVVVVVGDVGWLWWYGWWCWFLLPSRS